MDRDKREKQTQRSAGRILYWMVGIPFISTMLTTCQVSGTFAKYVTSDNNSDSAKVASTGVVQFEVWEHRAEEEIAKDKDGNAVKDENGKEIGRGYYTLNKTANPVKKNEYKKVLPGVDIPKDPYVKLHLNNNEVDYELYITVTEKDFPTYEVEVDVEVKNEDGEVVTDKDGNVVTEKVKVKVKAITYYLRDEWDYVEELSKPDDGVYVYKYNKYIDSNANLDEEIPILKNDKLYVSEHFVGQKNRTFSLIFSAELKQID